MPLTITNRDQLIRALSALGYQVATEQGAFDGLFTGDGSVTVSNITDATTVGRSVLQAASTSAARTAIGAGTSSLALGTTGATAKAGDYTPSTVEVSVALKAKAQIAALALISTPDATDPLSVITLANANKVALNTIIAALKA